MTKEITIQNSNEGECLAIAGGNYQIIMSGAETSGEYAIIEMNVPPGGGPGPHAHAAIHESFYIVSGEVEFKTKEGKHLAKQGAFIDIPFGGEVHCFKNISDKPAQLLCTVYPAGLEEFFKQIGERVQPGEFLPPKPMTEEGMKKLTALGEEYGQEFFPPNYFSF